MKKHVEVQKFNIPVDLSMYDKLPYHIDPDIKKHISLVSGNIIKGYHVNMEEEKRIIDPLDFDPNVIDSHGREKPVVETQENHTTEPIDEGEASTYDNDVSSNENIADEIYEEPEE